MPTLSYQDLLERAAQEPEAHLAHPDLVHWRIYEFGYNVGLGASGLPIVCDDFDQQGFLDRYCERLGLSGNPPHNLSALSLIQLRAVPPSASLRDYVAARALCADCSRVEVPNVCDSIGGAGVVNLLKERVRKKPGMYFGGPGSVTKIWTFIRGYSWARADTLGGTANQHDPLAGFQQWMEDRHPYSQGIPWHRTLEYLCLWNSARAWESFFENLELFEAGKPPDTLSETAEIMLDAIKANSPETAGDPELEKIVRRIAPN